MFSFKPNKKYTLIALYAGATIAVAILLGVLLFNLSSVGAWISALFSALSPLFYGLVIAYLTRPLVSRFERLFRKLFGVEKKPTPALRARAEKIIRALAILVSFLLLTVILFCFVFFVIPLLVGDGRELVGRLGNLAASIAAVINRAGELFGVEFAVSVDQLFSLLENSSGAISDWLLSIVTGLSSAVFDILVGVCLSLGILYHRGILAAYAISVFPPEYEKEI